MAKEKKQEFVTHITPRSEDFSQWYTDVILQDRAGATMPPCAAAWSSSPYGYAIWERIQEELDAPLQGHRS